MSAQKDKQVLFAWWGRDDWSILRQAKGINRGLLFCQRLKNEFGYRSADPWPIFDKKNGRRVMYFMIHATDHPEAPYLMNRAYHKAVAAKEP